MHWKIQFELVLVVYQDKVCWRIFFFWNFSIFDFFFLLKANEKVTQIIEIVNDNTSKLHWLETRLPNLIADGLYFYFLFLFLNCAIFIKKNNMFFSNNLGAVLIFVGRKKDVAQV